MAITTSKHWQKSCGRSADVPTSGNFDPAKQVIAFAGRPLVHDVGNGNPMTDNRGVYGVGNAASA